MTDGRNFSPKEIWRNIIKVAEAQTDLGKTYYLIDEHYDFIPLVKEYLDMIRARAQKEVSPNTVRTYCSNLWYFIVFLRIKGLSILAIDGKPDELAQFKLWLMNPYRFYEKVEVLSPYNIDLNYVDDAISITTQNAIISRVSSLYWYLKAAGRIKENPVIYSEALVSRAMRDKDMLAHTRHNRTVKVNMLTSKVPKILPKTVDATDFQHFLDSVNLLRDKVILLILKEGGLRAGELLGIKLEDIDFGESGVWARFRVNNINMARAKAGYGRDRFVHLPADLMALIDRYISSEWLESNAENDFLFVVLNSPNSIHRGNPMTKSTLDSMFRHYSMKVFGYSVVNGKKVSLKHIYPHQLRHYVESQVMGSTTQKGYF